MRSLDERLTPGLTAVVVIDVQNDFCHPDGYYPRSGVRLQDMEAVASRFAVFLEGARRVGIPIIFSRTHHSPWSDAPAWLDRRMDRTVSGGLCEPGSWGADFYVISPRDGDHVVTKHRYSAFHGTDLELVLRSRGIENIVLGGVVTNLCVETTARDACGRDFYVVVLEDCCTGVTVAEHRSALFNLEHYFGKVARSGDVLQHWKSLVPQGQ